MSEENLNSPLIEIKNLKQHFSINMGMFRSKPLKAVDGVSFTINKMAERFFIFINLLPVKFGTTAGL